MFELLLKMPESVEADAVEITLVPVSTDKVADDDDDPYSARMCPQPMELMLDVMSEIFDPKRKHRRVKKRPLVPRRVLSALSRPREYRSAPRRGGGAEQPGDDGGGGSGEPPGPPPARHDDAGRQL